MLYFRSLKRSAGRHVQEVQVWTFDSSVGLEQRNVVASESGRDNEQHRGGGDEESKEEERGEDWMRIEEEAGENRRGE